MKKQESLFKWNVISSNIRNYGMIVNKRSISALNKQIEALDKAIKQCVLENEDILQEVHIMTTMPGVAWVSACTILAELGSLKQYSSRELSFLSGLAPRWFKSGSSIDRSYMGKRGSKRLRQVLYLCSIPAVKKSQNLAELHNRITSKGKMKMTARCACMRKLLIILRAMVVNNQIFIENYQKSKKIA